MRRDLGIVLIGHNEGRRLRRALDAAADEQPAVVAYVDSGSTDDSLAIAESFRGRVVVEQLDASLPFTAARGRNRGFQLVRGLAPEVEFVQFVDGDCILTPGWTDMAVAHLTQHPHIAIVAGRLREEDRERNAYHRLADMEWDVTAGDVESTGGIAMVRARAFEEAGGFDASVSAGEELELALRIRARGFRILRLPEDMAYHNADIERFSEWWQRAIRSGHGYAEGLYLQARYHQPLHVKTVASIAVWGALLPIAVASTLLPTSGLSLSMLAAYGVLWLRVRAHRLSHGDRVDDAALYATAIVLGKFAGVFGVARFLMKLASRRVSYGRFLDR